jgi:hypothetical protein
MCVAGIFVKQAESFVGMVAGYELDGLDSIPCKGKRLFYSTESRPALGPTHGPIQWVPGAFSLGLKWPGHEAHHPFPSPLPPSVFMA